MDETAGARPRPHVLILSHIQTGHLTPNLGIASGLVRRGWSVFFLGPSAEETRIPRSGAVFLPLLGAADIHDADLSWTQTHTDPDAAAVSYPPSLAAFLEPMSFLPPADIRTVADTITQCVDTLPAQWTSVAAALRLIHTTSPQGAVWPGVVILCDAFFHGLLPLYRGAALLADVPRPLSSVCVSVTPPFLRSQDLPPFGLAQPFDPSPAGRAAASAAWERWSAASDPIARRLDERMREAGAPEGLDPQRWPFASGANYLLHPGGVLQLGVPGLEYPRSDWPPGYRFVGILPSHWKPGARPEGLDAWWDEVLGSSRSLTSQSPFDGQTAPNTRKRKQIVVVTQGTFQVDLSDLLLPTLAALADRRDDVLVVAILGRRGARLPSGGTAVPANARVADFLPYDAVLPHADVWVHNGGFGAVTHGIAHGVPMVVAGQGQDKGENARRIGWSGIGEDMGTARPTPGALRAAIDDVLGDGRYRNRIAELQKEAQGLDTIALVEAALLEAIDK